MALVHYRDWSLFSGVVVDDIGRAANCGAGRSLHSSAAVAVAVETMTSSVVVVVVVVVVPQYPWWYLPFFRQSFGRLW